MCPAKLRGETARLLLADWGRNFSRHALVYHRVSRLQAFMFFARGRFRPGARSGLEQLPGMPSRAFRYLCPRQHAGYLLDAAAPV
jgi:hypothetical protein